MSQGQEEEHVPLMGGGRYPTDAPGCCRMAWTKLPRSARTCPAPLQWLSLSPRERVWEQGHPGVSRSCPGVGDRGQPGPNRAGCVCPDGHWGDQHGDTPSL